MKAVAKEREKNGVKLEQMKSSLPNVDLKGNRYDERKLV